MCTNPKCGKEVPLFPNYLVAQKKPSIRYWRDARCPKCSKTFDWELEPATLIAEPELMRNDGRTSAGELRGNVRWSFGAGDSVTCPWCQETVAPLPPVSRVAGKAARPERKKVPLSVLLCPHCESVWQWRGEVPEQVACPACGKAYDPHRGNVPDKGKFVCPACGTKDAIIASIRRLPEDQLLPMKPYAIEGYCAHCAGDEGEGEEGANLFNGKAPSVKAAVREADHPCRLTKTGGKFFKRVTPADLTRYQAACQTWERGKERLPYPRQEIPWGEKTKTHLIGHHYRLWHHMFNHRQLLCLGTLLDAIAGESDHQMREQLLSAFLNTLNNTSDFCSYRTSVGALRQVFARHDYHPKHLPCENNVWGAAVGMGGFDTWIARVVGGKQFAGAPWDYGDSQRLRRDPVRGEASLTCADAAVPCVGSTCDFVVTDPPYASNVNYSELSDYFYVWLRLVLANTHAEFAADLAPKAGEIIQNPTRGRTVEDFEDGLTKVFRESYRTLADGGLLVFTFHHAEGSAWESLLRAVCNAGFELESVYPIHGESESSMHLMGKEGAISYDLIHICRKRDPSATVEPRSWAGVRQEIRRRAREEIRAIEAGRYGNEPLSPADVNIVLIGKCLELYSRHYGTVIDYAGQPVQLHEALNEIKSMVDDLVAKEHPLPPELEDVDAESRVYLLALCANKEIRSDDVNKLTRGVLEPEDLIKAGLLIKGRAKRGRTYEVKQPGERYRDLLEKFRHQSVSPQRSLFDEELRPRVSDKVRFIDHVHLLMGLAEAGENLLPWLERFRGLTPQIRAACVYLRERNAAFAPTIQTILGLMDPGPLFRRQGEG